MAISADRLRLSAAPACWYRAQDIFAQRRLRQDDERRSDRSIRVLRGIGRAFTAIPGIEAFDFIAVSRSPGLSRGNWSRPTPCPAAGGEGPLASGTRASGTGSTECGLLSPSHEGQSGAFETIDSARSRLSFECDGPWSIRLAGVLR